MNYIKFKKMTWVAVFMLYMGSSAAQTTITVDWALDEEPNNNNHTCNYTQGGLFFPDTTGSGADKCTLRRALREAGAIANDDFCSGCAPVTIVFNGLNGTDGNADDVQFNAGQWVLPIAGGASTSDFGLYPQTITDVTGPVNIVGSPVDIQNNNEMPLIMVRSSKTLEIELSQVSIQSLGFYGGMSVHAKEANFSFMNNTWGLSPDGSEMVFAAPDTNIDNLAGNHGVLGTNNANDLLVQNNIITGAGTYAVEVSSSTTGLQIVDNWIGLNINGTVPAVPDNLACRTFQSISPNPNELDENEWFGGAGINIAGTGAMIQGNVIAGLQNIRSTNDTPPQALTVFGALHTIENNIIGQDVAGGTIGVCGQGIKFSTQTDVLDPQNNGHLVIDNLIDSSRNGFENTKGAILWTDTSSPAFLDGGNTVRGNIVINGPERYFEMGPMISSAKRLFEPAVITSISGTQIAGTSNASNVKGDPSPCPNCLIDFYLDDDDENEEALAHLGAVNANANGDFSFNLSAPLPGGFGIRTTSTAQSDGVIGNTWSGTTSTMSNELYGLDIIFADGFEGE
ncbi:hypothetical protein OS175_13780 [Marinicella sp. S1101]|uniref:hypothetical protein n=1 Tax=Marinicella marina TaxID=2996016 RepID=UPI002260A140|nr:hypothetical protein [Marinicella marina]MCX7554942.1 hypothetical protein [Marinicella marina]MDJ1141552.1 hypothetical protein [Marinicella marina]